MRAERRRPRPISLEAETLLTEGRVADAIESVQETEDVSAREARHRVEAHIAANPMLKIQLETQKRESRQRVFFWLLLVDAAMAAGLIWYLFFRP